MASGISAWNIATSAGVEWTETWRTTDMGDPTIVYGIITWEMNGPYLFTALLKVSYQLSHLRESLALRQVVRVSKNLCHRWVRACRIRVPMLLQRKIKTLYIWVIDQACSVKMAGHWPRFFWVFMDRGEVKVYKFAKKERQTGQTWSRRVVPNGQVSSILPARIANHSAGFDSSCPISELAI